MNRGLLVRRMPFPDDPLLPVLRLLIESEIQRHKDFVLLQIGANDGQTSDPVREIVLSYQPTAVLVEPLPGPFKKLERLYRDYPNVRCVNAAVAHMDGETDMYVLETEQPCEEASLVASLSKNVAEKGARFFRHFKPTVTRIKVRAISFNTLIAEYRLDRVNCLQIDAEGFDLEILKMCFGSSLRPRIINFESVVLRYGEKLKCHQLLKSHGYQFLSGPYDTLAYLMSEPGVAGPATNHRAVEHAET